MKTIQVNRFDGGISDDPRQNTASGFQVSEHFDIFTNPHKLTPYRASEADTNDGSTSTGMKQYTIQDFIFSPSDSRLYGLGRQASFSRPKIFYKADLTQGNWTLPATAEGGAGLQQGSFIQWGTTPTLWMFSGTTNVSKWVIDGAFTDTVATVGTITTVAQSVIAKDNNMYMFYNNKVVRVSPTGTVTDAALTLPSTGRITSACNYGNYLAITWVEGTSNTGNGNAYLYIWDLISPDITERVDWGNGVMKFIVGNINGAVVGVTDNFLSSLLGVGGGRVFVKIWNGGAPQKIKEIKATTSGGVLLYVSTQEDRMYWAMNIAFNGLSSIPGIWCVSKNTNGNYAVTIDRVESGATALNGFALFGNYMFIAHSHDGSITKTNDQPTFTETSIYESQKFTMGDIRRKKQPSGVWVTFEALPTAGQVVLKYRKNEETSYTTIFTETTDSAVVHESVNIESTGEAFPQFNEIQFRIESTGGAVITGYGFNYDEMPSITK